MDEDAVRSFDTMADREVQSFIGSRSVLENLNLIPGNSFPHLNSLQEADRKVLFADLETVLPQVWRDKIWEILWRRWKFYEDFCSFIPLRQR